MTHAEAFAAGGRDALRNPVPNCDGRLDLVGRFWGTELVEVMSVRQLYQCRRCGMLIGLVGSAPVWVRAARPP